VVAYRLAHTSQCPSTVCVEAHIDIGCLLRILCARPNGIIVPAAISIVEPAMLWGQSHAQAWCGVHQSANMLCSLSLQTYLAALYTIHKHTVGAIAATVAERALARCTRHSARAENGGTRHQGA